MKKKGKIIAMVGPTASRKSDVAIAMAKKWNGEIISADSRQVFRGLDIGTGKVTRDPQPTTHNPRPKSRKKTNSPLLVVGSRLYVSQGIRHHLLDVASPKREYNVTHFVRDAKKALEDIKGRGKLPILCGGTGFWVQALLEGQAFPEVKPNKALRKKLEKKTAAELFSLLQEKDQARAQTIDPHNKIRLIRALEIIKKLGKVPPFSRHPERSEGPRKNNGIPRLARDDAIVIALNPPREILYENIRKRLQTWLKRGLLAEISALHQEGVSWQRFEHFGLEYRYAARYLQKKITKEEMLKRSEFDLRHYAKRQLSWLRRWERQGTKIHWIADRQAAFEILKKETGQRL